MTAIELQQWKNNFIEDYLNKIDSIEVMSKLEKYTKRIMPQRTVSSPIAFSVKEANIEIDKAEAELSEGKGLNENEIHQYFEEWRKILK